MNIQRTSLLQKNGGLRLTIKSLLEKLVEFIIKLRRPKTTKTSKTITKDLERPKTISKISQRVSPDVQIKQVEQVSDTVTSPSTIITVQWKHREGKWYYSNGEKPTSKLPPGNVIETCALMAFEDHHSEIKKYGKKMMAKLPNKRNYVLSTSKKEYYNKKCYSSKIEHIKDKNGKSPPTGKPRDFHKRIVELAKWKGAPIYYVKIEKSEEILRKATEFAVRFAKVTRHLHGDNFILAFARITKSTLVTLDGGLVHCAKKSNVKTIRLDTLLSGIGCYAIEAIRKERENHFKKQARPILLFGNKSSFHQSRKKR